jgi:hypothetical protein
MGNILKLFFMLLLFHMIMIFNPDIANAARLFQDDFEYSADCTGDLIGSPLRPDCFQLSGWKWSKDNWGEGRGVFGISSLYHKSGNRSFLLTNLPYTNNQQAVVYIEADTSFGSNVWISIWIYPDYETGKLSRFDITNKIIYVYGTPSSREWCVKIGTRRYTGTRSWSYVSSLPDDHTGLFTSFDQEGCAEIPSGQNLGDNSNYIPMNVWSRLIVHVDTRTGASPNMETWITTNGITTKVAEHTVTWTTYDFTVDRIKLGGTFPGEGSSANFLDSWIFIDDVIIADSKADLDWPPSPPKLMP